MTATRRAASSNKGQGLMDIEAVADLLGVQVRHVRRLVTERRIPFIKWGRLLRFDPIEIETWIESARMPVVRLGRR